MAKTELFIGDGSNTVFDVDVGFSTAVVAVRCLDLLRDGNEVMGFQLEKQTPNATSIRLTLSPPPPTDSIRVIATDGTEAPD